LANINLIGSKSPNTSLFFSNSKNNPLIVALVQTGIKIGVCTFTPFNSISQTLAFHFCLSILNFSLDIVFIYNKSIILRNTKNPVFGYSKLLCFFQLKSESTQQQLLAFITFHPKDARQNQRSCISKIQKNRQQMNILICY
jgi:hypothetical protein